MNELDPVLGRADRIAWHDYQVKGNLLASRERYVREHWGGPAVRDVAERLGPDVRAVFESTILPFAWHPFRVMAAIDRAIIEGPMGGDVTEMKAFGATVARYDLPTLYKMLFKLGTPSFLVKRVGVVYRTYVRGGAMEPQEVTPRSAGVALTEGALPLYFCQQGVPGWFTAAIELSGGKDVRVEEATCVHRGAPQCSWRSTWA
jgi:predicted hydrocarbon binding protein